MTRTDRRNFLSGCLCCAAATGFGQPAGAEGFQALPPLLAPGYRPQEKDERGLWMQMGRAETDIRASNLLIRDAALNAYLTALACKVAGSFCPDVRVYVVRTPYFNASMAPNGMMQIWSGLLLRCRNEAQLAAVLGHETGHFTRKHTLKQFRDIKDKTAVMNLLALPLAVAGGQGAVALGQLAMMATLFSFTREQEREADTIGLDLMAKVGYEPGEASAVWQRMIGERDASFAARGRKTPPEPAIFATHPQSKERMAALAAQASAVARAEAGHDLGTARYRAAVAPLLPMLLEDQVKLDDHGGSLYLLDSLAADGQPGELAYWRGEVYRRRAQDGDLARAIASYRVSIAQPDARPAAHRALGYALLKSGEADAGRQALRHFLTLEPAAPDRAMIEFMLK